MTQFVFDKLSIEPAESVRYYLNLNPEQRICLNDYLEKPIDLSTSHQIHCVHCGKKLKKTYQNGYCFPCATTLARCDLCIVKPELCHFHLNTCREPEWGLRHCMQNHYVYLANTSGLKVGITREKNIPTRWLDQGATQALPILQCQSRLIAGLCEVAIAKHVKDKTDWRAMLKGDAQTMDLQAEAIRLLALAEQDLSLIKKEKGEAAFAVTSGFEPAHFIYPVVRYPTKVVSLAIDKAPIKGTLLGMKAQYLILDTGVLNFRKWAGWQGVSSAF